MFNKMVMSQDYEIEIVIAAKEGSLLNRERKKYWGQIWSGGGFIHPCKVMWDDYEKDVVLDREMMDAGVRTQGQRKLSAQILVHELSHAFDFHHLGKQREADQDEVTAKEWEYLVRYTILYGWSATK
jgi:hypothetical protein